MTRIDHGAAVPAEATLGIPTAIAKARSLYREGASIRKAAAAVGIGREHLRGALLAAGETRARLEFLKPLHERLADGIKKQSDGCWIWTSRTNNMGYGMVSVAGQTTLVHRVMFEQAFGPIPAGLDACHRCDIPACCNPHHIFIGTRTENMRDAVRKGRVPRGSASSRAKLNETAVAQIRRRAETGECQRRIAEATGLDYRQVNSIVRRRSWRHVP